jgi:hypothetical protein
MLKYDNYFLISLVSLVLISIVYFSKIREERKAEIYFVLCLISILFFVLWSTFLSYQQYILWSNHPVSKYLLPPYQKIDYFLNYVYFHYWRDFYYRLLGILLILIFMKFLNFIFDRDIFYEDEKILIPYFSLFYFFPYNMFFIFLGFLVLLLNILIKKELSQSKRFSFKNYWLYLAYLVFILQPILSNYYEFLKYAP